jgi:hypothetical protein
VGGPADVVSAVERAAIGRPLDFTINRNGSRQDLQVIPAEMVRQGPG